MDHKVYYEKDAARNRLWGTLREIALSENILRKIVLMRNNHNYSRILDLGCGDGFFLHSCSKKYKKMELYGADLSQERLRQTEKNVSGVKLSQQDIYHQTFSEEFFDFVVCSEVLEHLEHPVVGLRELWRVTKKRLILTVPNDQPIVPVECPNCSFKHYLSGHIHQISEETLRDWIQEAIGTNCTVTFNRFHTIFTYNKITLRFPEWLRHLLDAGADLASKKISFFKPNFLMAVIDRNSSELQQKVPPVFSRNQVDQRTI
ncbi:MAG: methyltransferase domain-containing protein [Bacteriovoracia bacterium]